jgi:hypothetical protein
MEGAAEKEKFLQFTLDTFGLDNSSLLSICRDAIVADVIKSKHSYYDSIDRLTIPECLKNYLAFDTELRLAFDTSCYNTYKWRKIIYAPTLTEKVKSWFKILIGFFNIINRALRHLIQKFHL